MSQRYDAGRNSPYAGEVQSISRVNFLFLAHSGNLHPRPVTAKLLQEEYRSHLHRYGEMVCQGYKLVKTNFPCGVFLVVLATQKAYEPRLTKRSSNQH